MVRGGASNSVPTLYGREDELKWLILTLKPSNGALEQLIENFKNLAWSSREKIKIISHNQLISSWLGL